jgi:flavin-dependent dehydrogenase
LEVNATYDLIVIGGGPAGTAAAIIAARSGARVLLLEKGRFPRQKVCGEFVSAESLLLLRDLLSENAAPVLKDALRISEARMFLDGRMLITAVDPPAASIARYDLDRALWSSAVEAGVEAKQETTVQQVERDGQAFHLASSAGAFAARAVINASGRWSNLTRASFSASERWIGIKSHFAESTPPQSVDLYFFKGGYCGVQPVAPGEINACAMVKPEVATSLPQVMACHPELLARSRGWEPIGIPVNTSPLIFREPEPERDGVWMAGDAAGFVDPFVGDGISLALRSGAMAARCLQLFFGGEQSLPQASAVYSERYGRELSPVFRNSSGVRRLLGLPLAIRKSVMFFLQKTPAASKYLIRKTR